MTFKSNRFGLSIAAARCGRHGQRFAGDDLMPSRGWRAAGAMASGRGAGVMVWAVVLAVLGLPTAGLDGAIVWQRNLRFNEFRGQPGGFENNGPSVLMLQDRSGSGDSVRHYDVLAPGAGNRTGTMVSGQDGVTDLSIRSRVIDGSDGRWQTVQLERDRTLLQAHATTASGTSRSGDSAVMAFEITFAANLQVTAEALQLGLSSVNGRGDLYEWAFVTVGGIDDAPFDPAAVATYTARDYSLIPDGTIPGTGNAGTAFATNRPISSFLTGDSRTTAANGLVKAGWWATEGFNAAVYQGPERAGNPAPAPGNRGIASSVTGASLGLAAGALIQKVTVWFGFNDVGFDTNGDGFTASRGDQTSGLSSLRLGSSGIVAIPEPDVACLVALGLLALVGRARHRQFTTRRFR